MKILNLLVGGPIDLWPDELKNGQIKGDWIGIDRGNLHLIERGIDPLVAIGDFDSLKPAELQLVRDHITQLGLKVALQEHHADRLDIYGATGGRLDHFLANLWMVLEPRFKPYAPKIRMIDKQNTITFFLPGTYQIEKEPDKKYLAFVALTPMDHLTLFDEKYQLNDYQVKHPMSLASNEFVGETARFKFGSGVMCVIQSKDINRYN
mgnify:CR=1 FL=1